MTVALHVGNAILILVWFFTVHLLLSRLRRDHVAIYEDLEAPSLTNYTWANSLRVLRFLLTRQYRAVPDRRIRTLGNIAFFQILFILGVGGATAISQAWMPITF